MLLIKLLFGAHHGQWLLLLWEGHLLLLVHYILNCLCHFDCIRNLIYSNLSITRWLRGVGVVGVILWLRRDWVIALGDRLSSWHNLVIDWITFFYTIDHLLFGCAGTINLNSRQLWSNLFDGLRTGSILLKNNAPFAVSRL